MNIKSEIKNLIKEEYKAFEEQMYTGKTKAERDELAQFFTPPEISIKLLEAYDVESLAGKIIRDPTSGSGNLLAAVIIAGADADKILGNDYDARMVKACRERIKTIPDRLEAIDKKFADELREKLKSFNDWQIHRGDATDSFCLKEFGPDYKQKLEQHYLYDGEATLFPVLSKEQEEFLREVD